MAEPKESGVRRPAVAGANRFYPAEPQQCRAWAERLVNGPDVNGSVATGLVATGTTVTTGTSGKFIGGIVPHAGWICSGAIAGLAIATLKRAMADAEVIVVFGAIHTPLPIQCAALDTFGKWIEPSGESLIAENIRGALAEKSDWFVVDDRFHLNEHAVEVELPLIEVAWPTAKILPIEVPLMSGAIEIGKETAKRLMKENVRAVFLASSDLTHYGPNYRFVPAGIGMHGLEWAKQNDRRLLGLVEKFDVDAIVPEVATHLNACGGGAIAATMAACREYGAGSATVLRHASSCETLRDIAPQRPDNAVGYASVVFM